MGIRSTAGVCPVNSLFEETAPVKVAVMMAMPNHESVIETLIVVVNVDALQDYCRAKSTKNEIHWRFLSIMASKQRHC